MNWLLIVLFAASMAWVEAACVYYLRAMVDRVEPYQAQPLPMHGVLGPVELVREAATLVMLLAVGALTGRTRTTRLGYTAIAFGTWDIFYYLFLKIICDWPKSLFDWDILFLIPLPWWGPVIAPVSIAVLMIAWGTLVTRETARDTDTVGTSIWWRFSAVGTALALYVFMADSFDAVSQGVNAPGTVLPTVFNWPLFALAVTLMAAPVAQLAWRMMLPPGSRALTS
jgi:Flp pilus assembly pilin Flp